MNISELLCWGESILGKKYSFDSKVLLAHCLNLKFNDIYFSHLNKKNITIKESELYKKLVLKRKKAIPTEYITGSTEFMGLKFSVNKNVLIPRQETECLIEHVLKILKYLKKPVKILDVGTGSGNIAVSIANYSTNSHISAIDISKEAIKIAKKNASLNNVTKKIEFIQSDIFGSISKLKYKKYDLIISNPPYIKTEEIKTLQREIHNEPVIALDGGKDGLAFYKRIIPESKKYLNKRGYLIFEIGYHHSEPIKEIMKINGYKRIKILKDYTNQERIIYGQNYY